MRVLQTFFLLALCGATAWGRTGPVIIKTYTGQHQDHFISQYDRVRLLTRQAQLQASARLGLLQYREGFSFPLTIRFADGAPQGIQNAAAYVRLLSGPEGFSQELVVNLDAASQLDMEFDSLFLHEMTHAVLNDAVGGQAATKIPHWVQEGLAQLISEEGMNRVKKAAGAYRKSQVKALLYDLDGPYSSHAYPQYYLAIEAMEARHSINAVQALVRNLIEGKTVIESVEDAAGCPWTEFEKEVRDYSLKVLIEHARPDL